MSAGASPDISGTPPDEVTLQNGRDVNNPGSDSVSPPSFPPSGHPDVNPGLSFAGAVHGTDPDPVGYVPDEQNELPS